jgi:hypothetical protein
MTTRPPVRLRGHHLICLQFFRGEGYDAAFVENLTRLVARSTDAPALIVSGADDVCAACPELGAMDRCASESAGGEDQIAHIDSLALEVLDAATGEQLSLAQARGRLESDARGVGVWRARACDGCAWENVCDGGWSAMLKAAEQAARADS